MAPKNNLVPPLPTPLSKPQLQDITECNLIFELMAPKNNPVPPLPTPLSKHQLSPLMENVPFHLENSPSYDQIFELMAPITSVIPPLPSPSPEPLKMDEDYMCLGNGSRLVEIARLFDLDATKPIFK